MSRFYKNNARKVMTTSAAAALAATAVAPAVASADDHTFSDVPTDHHYYDQIEALAEAGVIQGDEDGNFNPEGSMSRASAAEMLAKALDLQPEGENTFSDVPDDHWASDSITALYEAGIVQGDEDGNFNPSNDLSRAAIAEMVVKAYGLELDETNEVTFDDVDEGEWYANNVHILASHGLVQGNGEGQYSPENDMQRQHFAKLVYDAEVAYGDMGDNEVSVDSVAAVDNAYYPTGNAEVNAFSEVKFLDADGNEVSVNDTSEFNVYDSEGYFNEDGSLVDEYAEDGLPSTVEGETVSVEVQDAEGNSLGEVAVDIVSGEDYKQILDGGLFNNDGEAIDYTTMGATSSFDVTQALNYGNDVIGDDEDEEISLDDFENVDLSSSDSTVFVISDSGEIEPVSEGTANVVVEWNDQTFEYPVEVKAEPVVNSVEFGNGSTFELTTADNDRSFSFTTLDQHGAEIDSDVSVEQVSSEDAVDGLTVDAVNENGEIDVSVDTDAVDESFTATYQVKVDGSVLGEFTIDYAQAGETDSYELRTNADDQMIDYYLDGSDDLETDDTVTYEFVGRDSDGYVSEFFDANNYSVELSGVTEGEEEATLDVNEDGTVTVSATEYASEAGDEVTVTVSEGNIVRAEQTVNVQNTTPESSELTTFELAEGEESITLSENIADFSSLVDVGYFNALDQYDEEFNLAEDAEEITTYSSNENVFTVNADNEFTVVGEDGDTAELVVKVDDVVRAFPVTLDTQAPEITSLNAPEQVDTDGSMDIEVETETGATVAGTLEDGSSNSLDLTFEETTEEGVYTTEVDFSQEDLTDGSLDLSVTATDDVGNVSNEDTTIQLGSNQ